ncbi:MAG TPA: protein adenylyltransferase SelO family protein, partial [Actinomycetaceae bacterium]|nr:protein adenylyltransferase SelO family protein [Actinomycetaceae bacterium]
VLTRVASSHIRVGTFQYARATGDVGLLRRLADYTLERHYPQAAEAPPPERYLNLFRAVVEAQAALVARWMLVGFVHGVMNTDNTTMSGETIDYGPCAFLDAFDPRAVFSSIDTQGRYSYGNQPVVMQWNLARFAESLLPLIDDDQERAIGALEEVLAGFPKQYSTHWLSGMLAKLGLPADGATEGSEIVEDFVGLLASGKIDYTSSFRVLADVARAGDSAPAAALFADSEEFEAWVTRWLSLGPDAAAMDRVNPVYIARNHLVEEALGQAEEGDLDPFERLLEALRAPYVARPELVRYAQPAPPSFGPYRTFCGT